MELLRYDATGLASETIGPELGISQSDRQALAPRLIAARQALQARFDSGELGFINSPDEEIEALIAWAQKKRDAGYTDQVVIGIGGSNLGTRAILEAAGANDCPGLRTHFAENIDPTTVKRLFDALPLETTLFLVVTKSGTTLETMGQFWIAYARMVEAVGEERAGAHFVAITDPKVGSLRALANTMGLEAFEVPPNVGGRFSVLTNVGLVPLALAGYPLAELLAGARHVREAALQDDVADNLVMQLTAEHFLLLERGIDQVVMMSYSDQLLSMVDWYRQIWAESLGKAVDRSGRQVNIGTTPIKAWGVVDQHSQVQLYMEGPNDKHVIFVEVTHFDVDLRIPEEPALPDSLSYLAGRTLSEVLHAELAGTRAGLTNVGRPTSRFVFERLHPRAIGAFIFCWELVTAMMGELLDIDAFDQPGVELGKKIAHGLLGREGFSDFAKMAEGGVNAGNPNSSGKVVV
ncbi:MAG: glucose-6-phosphate isomerase [Bradymonadaceae bacterium]|nr:glucose-6-phosphate isomerase [Lujinxingiaceae bacterium]